MKIAISGAGIAGLTAAYWLDQHGHTVTIFEKSEGIRTEGYMIDFTGTGWEVANRMGIIPDIRRRAYPVESLIYKGSKDQTKAQISVHEMLRTALESKEKTKKNKKDITITNDDVNYAALNRRDLVLSLYEKVYNCKNVEIIFGKTIKCINQDVDEIVDSQKSADGGGVNLTLSDDSNCHYDMLIGCDGIHSHTRQLVFGREEQFMHQLGYQFAIFEIPPLKNRDFKNSYQMHVEPDFSLGVYPTQTDKWMVFLAYKISPKDGYIVPTYKDRVKFIRQKIQHLKWHVPEILENLNDDDYIFVDNIAQVCMERWYKGNVVLLGDAAYCPTLISGQGASMAMAGAFFLADALSPSSSSSPLSTQEACEKMDAKLRPHIEKIQKQAREFVSTFIPKDKLRIWCTYTALRMSNISIFKKIIGKQFTVHSIL